MEKKARPGRVGRGGTVVIAGEPPCWDDAAGGGGERGSAGGERAGGRLREGSSASPTHRRVLYHHIDSRGRGAGQQDGRVELVGWWVGSSAVAGARDACWRSFVCRWPPAVAAWNPTKSGLTVIEITCHPELQRRLLTYRMAAAATSPACILCVSSSSHKSKELTGYKRLCRDTGYDRV